jgi:hypothetical protein
MDRSSPTSPWEHTTALRANGIQQAVAPRSYPRPDASATY